MTQTIDDIIARFGQQGWLVQKARENYWVMRPLGLFNYKMFLLNYNPFTNKFQIVKPPNPDSHYDTALKILSGSVRKSDKSARQSRAFSDRLSMIKVPSMFFIRVGNLWINLAAIRTLSVVPATGFNNTPTVIIRWNNDCDDDDESSYEEFEGESGEELLAQSKKAWDIILQRLSPINPA
jgi:hypothetical protein